MNRWLSPGAAGVARTRRRIAERYLSGAGVEIGALHEPLPPLAGVTIRYVDRLDLDGLRAHYPELADRPLVAPDIVDDGERLTSLPDSSQDFVVANHFIEHCEEPIGTLIAFLRVLRPDGIAYLAVPDRRQGVDVERPATTFEHLQRDHEEGPAWSRSDHYHEWARLVDARLGNIAPEQAEEHARSMEERSYSIHFHAWDRSEFAGMLDRARRAYDLPVEPLELTPNRHEFIVVLRRRAQPGP